MRTLARASRGFTLLEVVVALAILGLSLMAIFDLNAGAVASHAYTKRVTVATLLARGKMTDLEQQLYDDGFSADDDEESGDFSDEGFGSYRWRARILAPRTQDASTDDLLSAIFGLPPGEDGEGGMAALAGLFGGGGEEGSALGAAAGPAAGLVQGQLTQFLEKLSQSVREVHLTVSWQDGKQVESLDLVTHVVSLGPGSDRNGAAGPGGSSAPGADTAGGQPLVNARTGTPVPRATAIPTANGTFRDPHTGEEAIEVDEYLRRQSGGQGNPLPGGTPPKVAQ